MYPAWPDQDAHNLLDKPLSLSATPVMNDSNQDDGRHAISASNWPTTIFTKHCHPRTTITADQLTLDEEEMYLAEVSRIVEWLQGLGGTRIKEAE